MKKLLLVISISFFSYTHAQIGIGTDTPDTSSILDLSPSGNDKGILIPRITETQKNSIVSPANGLLVFQTDNKDGFYYYSTVTSSWSRMSLFSEINEYGDIKTGIQSSDHNGWVKLDGRLKSDLNPSQQARATSLGIGDNLPNADNTFLVQNGNALGQVSGSNSKNISQANLPNVNFNVSVSSAGDHYHSSNATGGYGPGLAYQSGYRTTTGYDNSQAELDEVLTTALIINSSGSHAHTATANSGGSGTALDITPKSLSVNTFIYLGN